MTASASDPGTLSEALTQWARRAPERPACHDRTAEGWRSTSWRTLEQEARLATRAFRNRGVRKGDVIAIQARGGAPWLAAEWAAYRCGAVVVGLDPFAGAAQLAPVLDETQPVLALVETTALAREMKALTKENKTVVTFEGDGKDGWHDLLKSAAANDSADADLDDSSPDAPATRIYTSGTTGRPKGIVYTHRQVLLACRSISEAFGVFSARDRVLCWLPMAHLFQRMINYVALYHGAGLYCADDPREVVTRAMEVDPTVFVGVPRLFEKLHAGITERLAAITGWRRRFLDSALAAGRARGEALRSRRRQSLGERMRHAFWDRLVLRRIRGVLGRRLRFAISGSAPTPQWLLEFFHDLGLPIMEAYGVSENAVPMAVNVPGAWRFGSVGRPLSANEIQRAPDGELLVRGPGVCDQYADGKPLPRTRDGFHRTGDLGRVDGEGFLHLTGRKRELIKTAAGRRVSPSRVEAVYRRAPLVEQIAVFGHGRSFLTALITVYSARVKEETRRSVGSEQTRAALRARLWKALRACEKDLAPYERIRDFSITTKAFTIARGELTTTFKLKREVIETRRREDIERMYATAAPNWKAYEHVAEPNPLVRTRF